MAEPALAEIDPVVSAPFQITASDAVATAGSCFAQHIGRYLRDSGMNLRVTEPGHPRLTDAQRRRYNYGVFSARFGNLYSSRQLLQLLQRAYGRFTPTDDIWRSDDGRYIDPFRPYIQPRGFASETELRADRSWHLRRVRELFETLDVFVFTLGLTETWHAEVDGAVYPVCPGCGVGEWDPKRYSFRNLDVDDVVNDMQSFHAELRAVNPNARMIVTVSPVPLIATIEARHVLTSTVCSKSILRVAADQLERSLPDLAYFPSYEIITSPAARGRYFAENLRSVTEEGVSHVMRIFFEHFAPEGVRSRNVAPSDALPARAPEMGTSSVADVICDEERLDAQYAS